MICISSETKECIFMKILFILATSASYIPHSYDLAYLPKEPRQPFHPLRVIEPAVYWWIKSILIMFKEIFILKEPFLGKKEKGYSSKIHTKLAN